MTTLDGKSLDIKAENIERLRQIFPEAFEEGKIDFDKLRQLLGDYVDDEEERYRFTWNGKGRALRLSQTPSLGTLLPCKEESKDWDTTQNLYIEGDNLEVLKLLQKSYYGKVKMIYIDPPYNTGNDFVYKDDFKDNIENYKRVTGQVDGEGHKIDTNTESNGRFHTDWLNMMYPRLRLARNLLSDDGVIFISIDDNELANTQKICDDVFGITNIISCVVRISKTTRFRGNYFAPSKDYLLAYAKDIAKLKQFKDDEVNDSQFSKIETVGERKGEYYRDDIAFYLSTLQTRPNQRYFIECPDGELVVPPGETIPENKVDGEKIFPKDGDGVWRWEVSQYLAKKKLLAFKKTTTSPLLDQNGNKAHWNIYTKSYLNDKKEKGNIPRDVLEGFLNRNGSEELKQIDIALSFPKPSKLIKYLMKISSVAENSIILDFFSGSATTAHAVMQLNAEDSGNRKFIMVQLPEPTAENSEAAKAGYPNICEIGKERIRRAGEKIKSELPPALRATSLEEGGLEDTQSKAPLPEGGCPVGAGGSLDIGFKVFKLDSSNLQKWNPQPKDLELALQESVNNFLPGRTELDVVYEIMLKMGLDLALPIEERKAAGQTVYVIGGGALMICLGERITLPVAEEIAKLHKEYDAELWQVVFRDTGFASDMDKTNIKETLKTAGLDEDSFVCV